MIRRAALIAAVALTTAGCLHHPPTGATPPSQETLLAADGWPLAIFHYPVPAGAPPRARPVILCHGLGSNHVSLDLEEGGSLARSLSAQGFDVWAIDLRGHGASTKRPARGAGSPAREADGSANARPRPDRPEKSGRICFDDYVRYDVPAAIKYVQHQTGRPAVAWVGHSMGGMVAYAYLGTGGEGIDALVAIGSPGDMRHTGIVHVSSMLSTTLLLPHIYARPMSAAQAALGGFVPFDLDETIYHRENLSLHERRLLMATAVSDLSRGEVRQFRRWEHRETFDSNDGTIDYAANLSKITTPTLLISGALDHLAPPSSVQFVMVRLGSPDKTHVVAARANGFVHDFGHVDLTSGHAAAHEIYPLIADWLAKRDPIACAPELRLPPPAPEESSLQQP